MTRKMWLVLATGVLSIVVGALYWYDLSFTYRFLGPEAGSERETVRLWCQFAFGLGALLLLLLLGRPWMRKGLNDSLLILILSCIFIIQLPAFGLWLMVLLWSAADGSLGVAVHAAQLLLIAIIFVTGSRGMAGSAEPIGQGE